MMRRRLPAGRRPRSGALVAWLVLAGLASGPVLQGDEPLRYRRIFIPEADLQHEIRGLLPLRREEFERRASQVSKSVRQPHTSAAVHVARAEYSARIEGDQLVDGAAKLQIESTTSSPILLPLGPCNLALRSARWQGSDQPAVVGQDGAGQLGCLVEESRTLAWDWSLRGNADSSGSVAFSLQLPAATVSSLRLELASDHVLFVEGGVVSQLAGEPRTPAAPPGGDSPPSSTWLVEVGGSHAVKLIVRPRGADGNSPPMISVREQSTYSVFRSSLDLESALQVEAFQQAVPDLALRVDQPLQITRVLSGDQPVNWSVAGSGEMSTTVVVEAPGPGAGPAFNLRVEATGSWPADAPTALPRILLEGAVYQDGRVTVAAPPELGLEARSLHGCWQSAVTPASAGRGQDQMQFRLHEADAAIEIAASLKPSGLRESSGTQLVIDSAKISAVMTSEITSLGGNDFALEARISRRWIVDAVEVQPAEALSDRTLTADAPNRQLLRLNLQRALHESRPLRVLIRAHQRLPSGNQPLEEDFFRLASFAEVRTARRLVAVRTVEAGTRLQLEGDERLTRLDALALPEEEMRLFEIVPGPILFADDAGASGLTATLQSATPAFRVESELEALAARHQLHQSLQLRCIPESSPVGQLVVRLSPRPTGTVAWQISGEDPRELEVAPLAAGDMGAPEDGGDAAYRLTLARPRSAAFTIRAEWASPSSLPVPISLAAVPEATAQSGIIQVRSLDGSPLRFATDGLDSLPMMGGDAEQFSTLRGRFSYRPGRRASLRVLTSQSPSEIASVRIESLQVQSRFSIDGRGEHTAVLRLNNHGATHLHVRFPAGAVDLRQLDADTGALLPLPRAVSGEVIVPLPEQQRQVVLQFRYTSAAAPFGWWPWGRLEAPLPEPEASPLSRTWTVSLCPGLQARGQVSDAPNPLDFMAKLGSMQSAGPDTRSLVTAIASPAEPGAIPAAASPSVARSFDPGLTGWSRYEMELPPGPVASVPVVRSQVLPGLGIAFFLFAAIAALRLRRRAWVWPAAIVLLVLALLSPPEWTPLVGGLLFGLIAGGLGALLCAPPPARPRERSGMIVRRALVAVIGLVFIMGGGRKQRALADNPAAEDHRVVIATGDRQQPVGDYVYLAPAFYERLHKLTDVPSAQLPEWLLTNAQYHFPHPPQLSGAAPSLDEVGVRIDLLTFRTAVQVELPFLREQISLLEGRTRLDGEPIAVSWRADGRALLIPIESPGKHQFQLACGASLGKSADGAVLDLAIPPVSQSTASTPLAAEAQPIFTSAISLATSGEPGLRQYSLGPVARLVARWPLTDPQPAAAQVEVDQLTWWKLKPGSAVVSGKFRFRPIGGALGSVEIDVDPRLRIVPGSIRPASAAVEASGGARPTVRVVPAENSESEFTLSADWLWVGASGVGNVALPQITARADRRVRSWTGLSVDSTLTIADAARMSSTAITSDDFLIAWSEPETPPDLAADDLPGPALRTVTVLPLTPEPTVISSARWSVDGQQALVLFEARLSRVPVARFRHELDLPPALKVQSVRLTAGGAAIPYRWRQRPDGSAIVTLLAPPPPEQLLELEATMPRARNRPRLPLPNIGVLESQSAETSVRIYRQPQVAVQVQGAAGWSRPPEPELGNHDPELGRLVAALHHESTTAVAQPVIAVSPNQRQATSRLVLRVANIEGQWTGEAHVDLTVAGGVLDLIRLEVPAEWTGPFTITPAVEHRLAPLPGGASSQLIISPQQAISGKFHLTIRGPLHIRPNEGIRAPAIAVLDAAVEERIVVLPTRADRQLAAWETRGLQAVAPSALRLPEEWSSQEDEYYRVVAETFAASATFPETAPTSRGVALAEISMRPQAGQRLIGQARFTFLPPNSGEVVLEMPPQSRLIQAALDGVHCQCRADGLRSWRIATNSLGLPTSLEVFFEEVLPPAAPDEAKIVLRAPRLKDLAVTRTLWSVTGLEPDGGSGKTSPRAASELEAAIVRTETLARNLTRVAEFQSGALSRDVLTELADHWQKQYRAEQSWAEARLGQTRLPPAEWNVRLIKTKQQATIAIQRLAQAGIQLNRPGEAGNTGDEAPRVPAEAPQKAILLIDGGLDTLEVRTLADAVPADRRWATAALVGGVLVGVWLLLRIAAVRDQLAARAPAIIAAMGISWWLLAPWAWLGWILVGLAVWLAVRMPRLRPSPL